MTRVLIRASVHRAARPGVATRGQSLVEFALAAPLFFLLVLIVLNGGLFLYVRNSAGHAADVGMVTLAAEGNYANPVSPATDNADQVALGRMRDAGLGSTALTSVTRIAVTREVYDTTTGTYRDAVATDPRAAECTAFPCQNVYTLQGTATTYAWPPANRSVASSSVDYAKLVINYDYQFFGGIRLNLGLTVTKLFSLEPQT